MIYNVNVIHETPRARRRRHNTERILEAAMGIVARDGLDALTIARVARAVDYTPGALYRYFDSKDALVVALQLEVMEAWRDTLRAAVERVRRTDLPEGVGELAAVVAVAGAYCDLAEHDAERFALVQSLVGDPRPLVAEDHGRRATDPTLALVAEVTTVLAAADGNGLRPGSATDRALTLLCALQGVLQARKLERYAPALLDVGRLAAALVPTLLLGWGASPCDLEAAQAALETR